MNKYNEILQPAGEGGRSSRKVCIKPRAKMEALCRCHFRSVCFVLCPDCIDLCVNAIYVELSTGMNMYSIVEKLCRNVNFEVRLEKVWVQ